MTFHPEASPYSLRQSPIPLFMALIAVFLLGFILLTANSIYFARLEGRLKAGIENAKNRVSLSEWIAGNLLHTENDFFQMVTAINSESQHHYRQQIELRLKKVDEMLTVIEKGGHVTREIQFNQTERMVVNLDYSPESQVYNLETVKLRPRLPQLREAVAQLSPMLETRCRQDSNQQAAALYATTHQIKDFIKQFSPFFSRTNEYAVQLLYDSNRRLAKIEALAEKRHGLNRFLEIVLIILNIILVMSFSVFLLRKEAAGHRRLRNEIAARGRLEEMLLAYQNDLEQDVKDRTRELVADIKVREKVEQQLRLASRELEIIFDNSPIGVILLKGNRRIARANQRAAEIFAYASPEEMIGKSTQELHLSQADFETFRERHYNTLKKDKRLKVEYRLKRQNGEPFWCSLSGTVLDSGREPDLDNGVLWVLEDSSARKAAAEEREKLIAELEKALEQVKTLAGIVPICMYCKKIRDDQGYWNQLEKFISDHSEAEFSHGICPDCYEKALLEIEQEKKEPERNPK
ncbi:MAG: PAS domain-containing protein [Deltaproteobacteria bacterium]|nr:PAS domain-containing protein [Deltaproteobacteria bacterium]